MPKRVLALLIAVFAVLLAGCGSDSKDSGSGGSSGETVQFDFAKAAEATKAKGSADVSVKLMLDSDGKKQELAVTGKADFQNGKLDLSMDLAKLLAANNVPAGDGKVQILVDGKKIWAKLPKVQGLTLPGGQQWISLDQKAVEDQAGIKDLQKQTEGEQLPTVKMTTVGTETLDGTEVTHLKAAATLRELVDGLPVNEKQKKDAITSLEKQDGGKKVLDDALPAEVWVDSSNALYRLKVSIKVEGKNGGQADLDLTFSNFGTPVTITPPAANEVFDATQFLESAAGGLRNQLPGGLGTP